jgi:hypothetical protein
LVKLGKRNFGGMFVTSASVVNGRSRSQFNLKVAKTIFKDAEMKLNRQMMQVQVENKLKEVVKLLF